VLVDKYGIPSAPLQLACSATEAGRIAGKLGFPVVMKVASPDISHKSDVGGVLLDLSSAAEVRRGYTNIIQNVGAARPKASITGVYLQKQFPPGQEVIAGMLRDPQFGPLLMFGSGGVEVEGLNDVAFALGPLTHDQALQLLQKTWAGRRLEGFRNLPPADKDAVIEVLLRLSRLVEEQQEISEIEINPLRVFEKGVAAIDVRVQFSE
jgi:acyl-CoA synthetase (NDP forming)